VIIANIAAIFNIVCIKNGGKIKIDPNLSMSSSIKKTHTNECIANLPKIKQILINASILVWIVLCILELSVTLYYHKALLIVSIVLFTIPLLVNTVQVLARKRPKIEIFTNTFLLSTLKEFRIDPERANF